MIIAILLACVLPCVVVIYVACVMSGQVSREEEQDHENAIR